MHCPYPWDSHPSPRVDSTCLGMFMAFMGHQITCDKNKQQNSMTGEQRRVAFALPSPGLLCGGGHGLGLGMGRSQERKCGEVSGGSEAISRAPEDCVFDVLIGDWPATDSAPVSSMTPRAGGASQGFPHQQTGLGWEGQLCHLPTSHFRASVCPSVRSNTQP